MARLMVEIDEQLLEEARRLSGARTKRATIELALKELVRRERARRIIEHAGRIELDLTREELDRWRLER